MKHRAALLLAGWLASAPLAPMALAGGDAADPFGMSMQGRASRTIAIDASMPIVMPGERVKPLMKFTDHTGLYIYHCHILEHEDLGMMRNYLVRA
jgi:FtsP/CotA-like multicopper oxidase with cupredoxin domain